MLPSQLFQGPTFLGFGPGFLGFEEIGDVVIGLIGLADIIFSFILGLLPGIGPMGGSLGLLPMPPF